MLDIVRLLVTHLWCWSWRYAKVSSTMTKTVRKQTTWKARMLKRAVSRLSTVHFQVNYADYASLFAVELEKLLLNNKTTALCQANMSTKHCIKPYQRLQTTTKNKLWKTLMLTSFQKLQLQSVSINRFTVLFTFFDVLSGLFFYVSLNLMSDPTVWVINLMAQLL